MSTANPFPGPRPYSAEERSRFFGRDDTALELADEVLSHRVLTVFGPSGAGKSSLLQAAVIPRLVESWDLRAVIVDAWPPERVLAVGPTGRLVEALAEQLGLGEVPVGDLAGAVRLAFRRSDRPLLLVLDQLEQLLVHHELPVLEAFVGALTEIEAQKGVALHVVLALREDYLGRWTDLISKNDRLIRHLFRVTRLRVDEITRAVVLAASAGLPPQGWSVAVLQPLIEGMAIPGQWRADAAEVESAYVQIVCRALWEAGGPGAVLRLDPRELLHHYLADTLASLGRLEQPARALMERKLITLAGSRAPVSLEGAREVVPNAADAEKILETLEQARILRAWEHHGDRFFELGHDWLARPIQDSAAQKREAALALQRRRRQILVAAVVAALVAVIVALSWAFYQAKAQQRIAENAQAATASALQQTEKARKDAESQRKEAVNQRQEADRQKAIAVADDAKTADALNVAEAQRKEAEAEKAKAEAATRAANASARQAILSQGEAERQSQRARDTLSMLAVRELSPDAARMIPFLLEVANTATAPGWRTAAWWALQHPAIEATAVGESWTVVQYAPDGEAVAFGDASGNVGLWSPGGSAPVAILGKHSASVRALAFSPDGKWLVSTSEDATARVWDAKSGAAVASLKLTGKVRTVAFSPDSSLLVTASEDGAARLWTVGAWTAPRVTTPARQSGGVPVHLWMARFNATGTRWLTAGSDGLVEIFDPQGRKIASSASAGGPCAMSSLLGASFHPTDNEVLLYGSNHTAVRWIVDANKCTAIPQPTELKQASYSPDGTRVLTVGDDGVARLWSRVTQEETPLLVVSQVGTVADASFDPSGRWLAIADKSGIAHLLDLSEKNEVIRHEVLSSNGVPLEGLSFSKDGRHLLTVNSNGEVRTWGVENPALSTSLVGPGGPALQNLQLTADDALIARTPGGDLQTIAIPQVLRNRPTGPEWRLAETTGSLSPYALLWLGTFGDNSVTLLEHVANIQASLIDPRYRFVVTASADGQVRAWPLLSDDEVKARLAKLGHRCISIEDRTHYLGETDEEAQKANKDCMK